MKKIRIFYTFILFFLILIFLPACHGKKQSSEISSSIKKTLGDFAFDLCCQAVNDANPKFIKGKYYIPQNLEVLLNRKFFENGKIIYLIEKYVPEKLGILDTSGFLDLSIENADFLDSLLVRLEEEKIAGQLENMAELSQNNSTEDLTLNLSDNAVKPTQSELIEEMLLNGAPAKEVTDQFNALTFMEYGDEIFIPQKTENGYVIIHSSKGNVIRNCYDTLLRLVKKEEWTILDSTSSNLNECIEYEYAEDKNLVTKKTVTGKEGQSIYFYTESGLLKSVYNYDIVEKRNLIKSEIEKSYDDDLRIKSEEEKIYTWNKDYSKIEDTFTKKTLYTYTLPDISPDLEYFEDGKIKMKTKYFSEKGSYTSQIYFENDLSVKTYYENNVRIKELYYKGENLIRTRNYEKQDNTPEL